MSESVTSLRLKVDSTDVKNADKDLNNLSKTAGNTEKSVMGMSTSFFSLGRVLSSIALLGTTQQFIKMADTMTGIESKLKLVTNNTLDLTMAQQQLFEISQKTRQGYNETVSTYSNFALAMGEMGKSQKDILRVTETVNKAIAISGGTAQMAAAATMQLGQAFASGTLRGDELNSILENSKGLAQAIADGMGVPIGKLRTLGSEGKITAEILATALEKSAQSVDNKFGKVGVTVDASMTVLANSITNMIGKVDKQLGVTGSLGTLITDVSKHIDENTQDWVDSVQEAMDKMYPVAEAGFTNIRDLSEVTFEGVNALFSVMVHAFDGAVDSMNDKYRELGFFDYMSLGFIVVIEGFRQIASGGLSALTFLGKQFNTFQAIALDAIAGVMGAMGKFQNAVGGDGSSFLEAQTFWANKANKVKQDGLLIDRTQKAILDDMGKGVDRLTASYDKLALKKVKAKDVDTGEGDKGSGKKGGARELTKEQIAAAKKAAKEAEKLIEEEAKIQRGYLEGYAELQANAALEEYNVKLGYEEAYREMAAQEAISQYEMELGNIEGLAARQAESALAFYEMTRSEQDKINEANLALYESNIGLFNDEQMQTFFTKWQDSIEGVKGGYTEILNEIDNLAPTSKDWTAGITGQSKNLANILNATLDLTKVQKDFNKERAKVNSSKELSTNEKTLALKKLETTETEAQYAAYGNLAGAMASAYKEGSAGAVAFTALQSAMGIASSWTAIANAWALPFPANIPAVAAVSAAVLPIISQLGGSSGGGASTASAPNQFEASKTNIENTYAPMTDRLDRQIELLEAIDKNGSASELGVSLAGSTFKKDYSLWVEDTLEKARLAADSSMSVAQTMSAVARVEQMSGVDIYKPISGSSVELNTASLRESYNLIDALIATIETGWGTFGQADSILGSEGVPREIASVRNSLNEVQNLIQEWAIGVVESMDDLKDASADFKGYFDDVTGSMYYETARLSKAFIDVGMLKGNNSFADYLQTNINEIDALQKFFTDETFGLLMSDSLSDIEAQILAIEELSNITGETFEGGAREALNYLESIQLVAEAMARSRENINSFIDSLLTTEEKAQNLADSMGISLATNVDELAQLFNTLAYDTEGLTDSELDLLNTNKDLIENTDIYNDKLEETSKSISTLESALSTITSTIEKLRSASRTSEQNLQVFYDAMAEAQRLSKTDDYAAYAEAVKKAADTSSALLNKDNFALSRDMEYAQLVAANQFEDLSATTLTQVDYLKQIEINTGLQVTAITEAMSALGMSINAKLSASIAPTKTDSVTAAYQSILGRAPDTSGFDFWTSALSSGTINESQLIDEITKAAAQEKLIRGFAIGTPNVPYDMITKIHQGEAIVPKPEAEKWRNGSLVGNNIALIAEIQSLRNDVTNLLKTNNSYQEKIDKNTKTNLFQGVV